jgi:hypothetical protein
MINLSVHYSGGPGFEFCRSNEYPYIFRVFSQSIHARFGTEPQDKPRQFHFTRYKYIISIILPIEAVEA